MLSPDVDARALEAGFLVGIVVRKRFLQLEDVGSVAWLTLRKEAMRVIEMLAQFGWAIGLIKAQQQPE